MAPRVAVWTALASFAVAAAGAAPKVVIFVMLDDVGWHDTSVPGHSNSTGGSRFARLRAEFSQLRTTSHREPHAGHRRPCVIGGHSRQSICPLYVCAVPLLIPHGPPSGTCPTRASLPGDGFIWYTPEYDCHREQDDGGGLPIAFCWCVVWPLRTTLWSLNGHVNPSRLQASGMRAWRRRRTSRTDVASTRRVSRTLSTSTTTGRCGGGSCVAPP